MESSLNYDLRGASNIRMLGGHLSQDWNQHVWKHWNEWSTDFPWLKVEQTGLGCSICHGAGVKKTAWSKFRACRGVARLIVDLKDDRTYHWHPLS